MRVTASGVRATAAAAAAVCRLVRRLIPDSTSPRTTRDRVVDGNGRDGVSADRAATAAAITGRMGMLRLDIDVQAVAGDTKLMMLLNRRRMMGWLGRMQLLLLCARVRSQG